MTTDNEMDQLLHSAGERWRAANPDPFQRTESGHTAGGSTVVGHADSANRTTFDIAWTPRRRRSRWALPAAAAAAVIVVAGGAAWFAAGTHHSHAPASGTGNGSTEPVAWGGLTGTDWTLFEVTAERPHSSDTFGTTGTGGSLRVSTDGTFVANDGINALSGPVRIESGAMHFGDVAVGGVGTTNATAGKIANIVDSVLQGDVSWIISNAGDADDLFIEHPGVGSLIYFGKPPVRPITAPTKMLGTWQLMSYTQSSAGSGSATGAGSNAGFGDLLAITGNGFKVQDRCYANAGKVEISQGTAMWSDVHLAGAVPCPSTGVQESEHSRNAFVDSILKGSTTWYIDSTGYLHIKKGDNEIEYAPLSSPTPTSSTASN